MRSRFLPEFELYVMLAIARLGDGAYGATVRREIERRTGRPVAVGALYTTLTRLDAKGLVTLRTGREAAGRGRTRRYCRVTRQGRTALKHSATMLVRMIDGLELVTDEM